MIKVKNKHIEALIRIKKMQDQTTKLENKAQEYWEKATSQNTTVSQADRWDLMADKAETKATTLEERANRELRKLMLA